VKFKNEEDAELWLLPDVIMLKQNKRINKQFFIMEDLKLIDSIVKNFMYSAPSCCCVWNVIIIELQKTRPEHSCSNLTNHSKL